MTGIHFGPRARGLLPGLGLGLVLLALFKDAVLEGRAFYERDIHLFWYGQVETFVRCVAAHSWPLWDPYLGFGQPMLANPSTQVLYPWTWLNLLMEPATYYTLYVVGHALLSGLGLFALGQRLGVSRSGSLFAAALWVTSGPFLSLVSLWHHLAGAAWLPWILLAAVHAVRSPTIPRSLLWGAALAGQILAGAADMCAMTGLLSVALVVHLTRRETRGRRARLRIVGAGVVALGFALALSAGQWLAAVEHARGSLRFALPEPIRTYWSVHPLSLLQALFPVFDHDLPLIAPLRAMLYESQEPFLGSLYLGLASLGFVLASFWGSSRLPRMLAVAAGVSVLVALGRHAFAYEAVSTFLPPLRILRYPSKAIVVTAFAWSLLAGFGFDAWRREKPRPDSGLTAALPTMGGGLLAGLGWFLTRFQGESVGPFFVNRDPLASSFTDALASTSSKLLWAGVLALATSILLIVGRRLGSNRGLATAGLLAVIDLVAAHQGLNPTVPRHALDRPPPTLQAVGSLGLRRLYTFNYGPRLLGKVYRRPDFTDVASAAGIAGRATQALGIQAYLPSSVARRWGLYGSYAADTLGLYPRFLRGLNLTFWAVEETPGFLRLLRIGAVSTVLALHTEGLEDLTPVAAFTGFLAEPIRVFRVPEPLPRTYVVGDARIADGLAAYKTLLDPAFDPEREVVLAEGNSLEGAGVFSGQSRILDLKPDRVHIEATLNRPGWVVLVDAFDPGWCATIDGQEKPVLRANVAFRAVAVPAGTHHIELLYRPPAIVVGLLVSLVAALLGLGVLLRQMAGPREPG